MKIWKKSLIAVVLIIAAIAAYLILNIRSLEVEQLSDDLYVIRGIGSNTTVLRTDQGTVVIDSMTFPMQGTLIRKRAEALTGQKVTVLINTHYHLDHTHGNPGFDLGTRVIATERTLSHLQTLDAGFWQDDAAQFLPNDTFTDRKQLKLGNKTLTLIFPGVGHTDGDLIVLLEEDKTLVAGDLLFHQHYPNIDLEAGGSVQQWSATIDTFMPLDFERVIPGHGATTDRNGLLGFQRFIEQLAMIGQRAAATGTSLDDTLESDLLTEDQGYTPIKFAGIPLGLDRKFVLRRAWEESTGNFERKN